MILSDSKRWNAVMDAAGMLANDSSAVATDMARLLVGRLRLVEDTELLVRLKAELSDFRSDAQLWPGDVK